LEKKDHLLKRERDNKGEVSPGDQNLGLSTKQILQEIGTLVNKERHKRAKIKKKNSDGVLELGEDSLLKSGAPVFSAPIPEDFATLKCLIQNIVKHEITKIQKD
jgi:hypothetical protein